MSQATMEASVALRLVGKLNERFVMEPYQRGYRWGVPEVSRLLDDLWDHLCARNEESRVGDYCLQPVVVALRGGEAAVVDGQQRLTTLFLLLELLRQDVQVGTGSPFTIRYTTPRNGGEERLTLPTTNAEPRDADEFHLRLAVQTMRSWLAARVAAGEDRYDVATRLRSTLYNHVKVIWYAVPDEDREAPVALFRRLNSGRIGLTNAELVKAELLNAEPASDSIAPVSAVQVRYRAQLELASEWDRIERELRRPELWGFLTAHSDSQFPTRMDLLLNLLSGYTGAGDPFTPYFWFRERLSERSAREVWRELTRCFETLRAWYDDAETFHLVGFLVASEPRHRDAPRGAALLRGLWTVAAASRKSEFRAHLHREVRRVLALTSDGLATVAYARGGDNRPAQRALLLFNVASTMNLSRTGDDATMPWARFPFWAYNGQQWSIEHVHAQAAQALTSREEWAAWIEEHKRTAASITDPELRGHLERTLDVDMAGLTPDGFVALSQEVLARLGDLEDTTGSQVTHGLGNLALLTAKLNSTLSNSAFATKRRLVILGDKAGDLVPLCTWRLFLKYYSADSVHQVHFWGRKDQAAYLAEISRTLKPYLLDGVAE